MVASAPDWSRAVALAGALGVLLAMWWPIRLLIAGRTERRFEAAHPRNRGGIIIGAEPILVRGTRPGAVLVLHGFNDSPQSVAHLAGTLHEAGWTVCVPALPGHARTLQEFARSGARQWTDAARDEFRVLRERHSQVAVCGLSMGGALALTLAAENPEVAAVVGIAPYVHLSLPLRLLFAIGPVAAIGARYLSGGGKRSVHDPVAADAMIAYRVSTPRLLRQLSAVAHRAFVDLPRVHQPVLIVQSREDNRIPQRSAVKAFERIGSPDKSLQWVSGAGHVITVDYGHERVERNIAEWLNTRLA
ncbi:MAG TPA: alpha/beta fold hydrolase [Gemmatimonadaceae bacterium]|nr:alpha/beta fold hydrolase [Gemmatimonadaceae bacterium]